MSGYREYARLRVRHARGEALRLLREHPIKRGSIFSVIGASIGLPVGALLGGGVTGGIAGAIGGALAAPLLSFLLLFLWKFFGSSYAMYRIKEAEVQALTERLSQLTAAEPEGLVRVEVRNGDWSNAAILQLVDGESGKPSECALHLHLALRFHNHDTAPSTVTDFRTELWLSQTEKAEQREVRQWVLVAPDGRRIEAGDLREELPARKLTSIYHLEVALTHSLEVLNKARADTAFLRLIVRSLGNPDWHLDVPLSTLRR